MRTRPRALAPVALALAVAAGCGGGGGADEQTELTVFAAASLVDAFEAVGAAFEEENPGVDVVFGFGASSALREQLLAGAPADVFASANASNMEQVIEAGEIGSAEVFATNELQIAVPAGNPGGVAGLEAFADEDLLIGLCAEEVPCGDFGRQVLAAAGVVPSIDTNELDVRALLGKVEAGELDAGLVYVSDVVSSGDAVEGIEVPDEVDVVATYPIGALEGSDASDVADAFIEFVLGEEGQAMLEDFGFGPPR